MRRVPSSNSRPATRRSNPPPVPPRPTATTKAAYQSKNSSRSQTVRAPVAVTRIERGAGPGGLDSITVRRREYISEVSGSIAFTTNGFYDNPGLAESYPWLNTIASNYEQYEILSRTFCFETEAPTTATGAVILSYDYDALDALPTSKTSALLVKDSVRTAPWQSARLTLKPQDLQRRGKLFVRSSPVGTADLKTYDNGRFAISTSGQASSTVVGELWFEYVIRFHIAQQGSVQNVGRMITSAGSVSKTAWFGSAPTYGGSLAITGAGNVMTFSQSGYYLLSIKVTGTGLNLASYTPTASSGSSFTALIGTVNSGGTGQALLYAVQATSGGTLTWDVSGATTVTESLSYIAPYYTESPP
nr:MAG: hypothetical protein [Narnaviridae sp.]